MFQMKEKDKTPDKELSDMEVGNLQESGQSNDCKDAQGTQEKNGWLQWED